MADIRENKDLRNLPACVCEFVRGVVKKMRYRRKVRQDVQNELTAHFEDELREYKTDEERRQKAQQLITDFGDVKLLAVLLRRAKKRCRPLWRTVAARTFQTVGVLVLCLIVYTMWFMSGKATIRVDYLAQLNQMSRPPFLDQDNAWPHYEKAIQLFVEPGEELGRSDAFRSPDGPGDRSFSKLANQEQEEISKWIEQNVSAWQEFEAGSSKAYCYREHEYGSGNPDDRLLLSVTSPHLQVLRSLARLGIWRVRAAAGRGQTHQALEDCIAVARAGSHWQGKGALIEQLVGLAISRLGHEQILRLAQGQNLSATDLKELHQQLMQMYPQGYRLTDIETERLGFLDIVQHVFTDGGPGGGHLVPSRWPQLTGETPSAAESELGIFMPLSAAASMIHARRDDTVAKFNELFDKFTEIAKMTPYQRHVRNLRSDDFVSQVPKYRYFLIDICTPAVDRASEFGYCGKASHEATVTILALKRWRLEKNAYPPTLDELLAAGYLKKLPIDPYSDKPLIYRRTDDDFVLYSVGPNFTDDGGVSGKDSKGQPRSWRDNGDTVFWPVPEAKANR
jgi:hypothetical protein